jgi:hypothetical protein
MARRRYLMAYDIADPRRLRRICTLMEDHGERLQYSVSSPAAVRCLGRPRALPDTGPRIV